MMMVMMMMMMMMVIVVDVTHSIFRCPHHHHHLPSTPVVIVIIDCTQPLTSLFSQHTHFLLTAALYPINQRNHGASNSSCGRNDDDDNHFCSDNVCSGNIDHNDEIDYNDNCDCDSDGDDDSDDSDDDVIPAGSVDVLYSSHTLEHISHYHSEAHDLYYFHRLMTR